MKIEPTRECDHIKERLSKWFDDEKKYEEEKRKRMGEKKILGPFYKAQDNHSILHDTNLASVGIYGKGNFFVGGKNF